MPPAVLDGLRYLVAQPKLGPLFDQQVPEVPRPGRAVLAVAAQPLEEELAGSVGLSPGALVALQEGGGQLFGVPHPAGQGAVGDGGPALDCLEDVDLLVQGGVGVPQGDVHDLIGLLGTFKGIQAGDGVQLGVHHGEGGDGFVPARRADDDLLPRPLLLGVFNVLVQGVEQV